MLPRHRPGSFTWFLIPSLLSALGARLGERVQRPIDVLSASPSPASAPTSWLAHLRDA